MASNKSTETFFFLRRIAPILDEKYKIIPFKTSNVLIGRSHDSSFPITDLAISRKHALFKRTADSWTITNLSCNGVLLNGEALPLNQEQAIPLGSTVQLCIQPCKFVFKFGCKVVTNRILQTSLMDCSDDSNSINNNSASTAAPTHGSGILLKEHRRLLEKLHSNDDKYSRLLEEKQQLADSLIQQQKQLEKNYNEERAELQRQVSDEQKKRQLREDEEALAQQLQEQVAALQERLESERQDLEQMIELERDRKQQLQQEQEAVRQQMQAEKDALEQRLELERQQMKEQVDERVQLVEEQMQLRLVQVEERLQQEKQNASLLSHELEQKAQSAERLKALEEEKGGLEEQLSAARAEGLQVTALQKTVQQMEQERNTLQQEMEMMEFAVTAEAKKAIVDTVEEVVDSELQCPICNELFIQAILLNCSHTFCQYCINCWKKTKRDCPTCRAPLKTETRNLAIESFINKIVQTLSQETRTNREQMIKDRENEIQEAEAKERAAQQAREAARNSRRGRRGRGNRGSAAQRRGNGRGGGPFNIANQAAAAARAGPSGTTRGGGASSTVAPPPAPEVVSLLNEIVSLSNAAAAAAAPPPITLSSDSDDSRSRSPSRSRSSNSDSSSLEGDDDVYYGGYGRCFNCGRRGHWANGCPDL